VLLEEQPNAVDEEEEQGGDDDEIEEKEEVAGADAAHPMPQALYDVGAAGFDLLVAQIFAAGGFEDAHDPMMVEVVPEVVILVHQGLVGDGLLVAVEQEGDLLGLLVVAVEHIAPPLGEQKADDADDQQNEDEEQGELGLVEVDGQGEKAGHHGDVNRVEGQALVFHMARVLDIGDEQVDQVVVGQRGLIVIELFLCGVGHSWETPFFIWWDIKARSGPSSRGCRSGRPACPWRRRCGR